MKKPRIFILEDEVITRNYLQRVLERLGYEVAGVAGDGPTAIQELSRTHPDLLIADIGLEGELDGVHVACYAREKYGIPTIFLTAYGDTETIQRARLSEPYGFLLKPFAEQELHATIEIGLQHNALRMAQAQELSANSAIISRTQQELNVLTSRLLRAQEVEREEIARDLHDDFGQRLALLDLSVDNLWQMLPVQTKAAGNVEFEKLRLDLDALARDLRNVSHRLHPSILDDLGLAVALREQAETFEERSSIPTSFSMRNLADDALSREVSLALYRIVQEALHNIGKHAGKDAMVTIALIGGGRKLDLTIRDTGQGFDFQKLRPNGIGLLSMAQRAEAAGGRISIESHPGQGTRIHVTVPLDSPAGMANASPLRN